MAHTYRDIDTVATALLKDCTNKKISAEYECVCGVWFGQRRRKAAPAACGGPVDPRGVSWHGDRSRHEVRLYLAARQEHAMTPSTRPNIIFIIVDDCGYADLGCTGQTGYRTPVLDQLAGEGVRFTQAYANAPLCTNTRVAVITGRSSTGLRSASSSRCASPTAKRRTWESRPDFRPCRHCCVAPATAPH